MDLKIIFGGMMAAFFLTIGRIWIANIKRHEARRLSIKRLDKNGAEIEYSIIGHSASEESALLDLFSGGRAEKRKLPNARSR